MSVNAWERFRQRLMEGNIQARYLNEWSKIRALTELPENESRKRLPTMVSVDHMDEAAFQYFRNAMILVNAAYTHRAGLVGITDPVEGQRRLDAYLASTEPDAARYKTFLTLRVDLEKIRRPQDQSPPYTPEELSLSEACNALFSRLAIAMNKAVPGLASKEVIDALQDVIGDYEKLKDQSKENNRARRQALERVMNCSPVFPGVFGMKAARNRPAEVPKRRNPCVFRHYSS